MKAMFTWIESFLMAIDSHYPLYHTTSSVLAIECDNGAVYVTTGLGVWKVKGQN